MTLFYNNLFLFDNYFIDIKFIIIFTVTWKTSYKTYIRVRKGFLYIMFTLIRSFFKDRMSQLESSLFQQKWNLVLSKLIIGFCSILLNSFQRWVKNHRAQICVVNTSTPDPLPPNLLFNKKNSLGRVIGTWWNLLQRNMRWV